jgi:hypothetical protein
MTHLEWSREKRSMAQNRAKTARDAETYWIEHEGLSSRNVKPYRELAEEAELEVEMWNETIALGEAREKAKA